MAQSDIRDIEGFRTTTLRKALTNLQNTSAVLRVGTGKKGDPFVYEKVVPAITTGTQQPPNSREPQFTPVTSGARVTDDSGSGGPHTYRGTSKTESSTGSDGTDELEIT